MAKAIQPQLKSLPHSVRAAKVDEMISDHLWRWVSLSLEKPYLPVTPFYVSEYSLSRT